MAAALIEHGSDPNLDGEAALESVAAHMSRVLDQAAFGPLAAMARQHLLTGGKLFRTRLTLKAAQALGVDARLAFPLAAAIELLHNATLVHDDVQDEDRDRRGQPTVWVRHGKAQAINCGDLLLMLPFVALDTPVLTDGQRWRLTRTLSLRAAEIACGQSLELELNARRYASWPTYVAAVAGKTGALCRLPIEGVALLAGYEPQRAAALGEIGDAVGLIFQVRDDALDLYGDKGREEIGSDVREGRLSAPIVAHLELHPEDGPEMMTLLALPREQTTDEDVHWIASRVVEGGALQLVHDRMAEVVERVRSNLSLFEAPVLRRVVVGAANEVLQGLASLVPSGCPPTTSTTVAWP